MKPHIVAILKQDLSVVLDFAANTVKQRAWVRSVIEAAEVPHELHVLECPTRSACSACVSAILRGRTSSR